MKTTDFDFYLPNELIATHPLEPRDNARMMVVNRVDGSIIDSTFYNLPSFLREGDLLVFNNSKVFPARLFGEKGGRRVEILLTNQKEDLWEVLIKPGKFIKKRDMIVFSKGLEATVISADKNFLLSFNLKGNTFWDILNQTGETPLPPYILKQRGTKHDEPEDRSDYQTVFADKPGSAAAPTAGLHFTDQLMERIKAKGVSLAYVDLHVGLGTFQPLREESVEKNVLHKEYFELSAETAKEINKAKKDKRRVIAVGTTVARSLESAYQNGKVVPQKKETNIFIYPGYQFKVLDGLVTNFHLPKSSLLMLVSAFYQREKVLELYNRAVNEKYRFFSYGDGLFFY